MKRKRLRSLTPSDAGLNGGSGHDTLRSPLAKRKKIAADRTGYSKLKQTLSADDLHDITEEPETGKSNAPTAFERRGGVNDGDDEEQSSDDDADDEDDFLAREMEEELG